MEDVTGGLMASTEPQAPEAESGRAYLVFEAPANATTVSADSADEAIRQHAQATDSDGVEFAAVPARNYRVRTPRKKVVPTWELGD